MIIQIKAVAKARGMITLISFAPRMIPRDAPNAAAADTPTVNGLTR